MAGAPAASRTPIDVPLPAPTAPEPTHPTGVIRSISNDRPRVNEPRLNDSTSGLLRLVVGASLACPASEEPGRTDGLDGGIRT